MSVDWKYQIRRLTVKGASYADVRYYPKEEEDSLFMWNGNFLDFNRSETSGFGVRVLVGGAWGFAASSSLADAEATFDRAFDNAAAASMRIKRPIQLADKEVLSGYFGILQQNEYNPLGNIAWVHLGAKSEIGCM